MPVAVMPPDATFIDDAERTIGRAILLVARARGRIAVRGRTHTAPLMAALGEVGCALAGTDTDTKPRLLPRVSALTEHLGCLIEEMADADVPLPAESGAPASALA
jgi:hypothetical protein